MDWFNIYLVKELFLFLCEWNITMDVKIVKKYYGSLKTEGKQVL
jgi:hypothetical protein